MLAQSCEARSGIKNRMTYLNTFHVVFNGRNGIESQGTARIIDGCKSLLRVVIRK